MALASGYTRVEYIGSSGTQYIDTGFKPNQDTRITCKAKVAIGSKTNWLLSAGGKFYFAGSLNGYYVSGYNSKAVPFSTECNTNEAFTVDANKSVWTFMSDTVGDTVEHTYANFSCDSNLLLFAYLINGSLTYGSVSIYSCRIYDNGTLVRDFVPCKNANGVAGLYDLVNNVFYTNAGSGTFTAGEVVVETYQIVNATDLNSAIGATANAIRIHTGDSKKITWDSTTGFASAVSSISTGGAKVATGSFYGTNGKDINVSLGFKPTRVIIYLMSNLFFGDDDLLGEFSGEVLYAVYDENDPYCKIKVVIGGLGSEEYYDEYYDETYTDYYFQLTPYQMSDGHIYPTSDGFKVSFADSQWASGRLAGDTYMYIAMG